MTTAAPEFTMGFDGDDFDAEVEDAKNNPTSSTGTAKVRQENAPTFGLKTSYAKKGSFTIQIKNAKGNLVDVDVKEIRGIIVDSRFGRQFWSNDNKPVCSTTSFTRKGKAKDGSEDVVVKGGWWKLSYGDAIVNDRMNPVGSRTDADGKLRSCADCMAQKLNQMGTGKSATNCAQKGFLYVVLFGYLDAVSEEIVTVEPQWLTIQTPLLGGIEFQKFVLNDLKEEGVKPNQVFVRMSLSPFETDNGFKTTLLTFSIDEQVDLATNKLVQGMLTEAIAKHIEDEKAGFEAWKAKKDAEKPKNGKGGGKASAAKNDEPGFDLDDDVDLE